MNVVNRVQIYLSNAEVWDEPASTKKHKQLSPEQKKKAQARAKQAGRSYPNLVDNMWAANQ